MNIRVTKYLHFIKWLKIWYHLTYRNLFPPVSIDQVSQRNLRNSSNLIVPRSRTNLYDKSFIPLATREWNSLPDVMKCALSLNSIKYLLDRDKVKIPSYYYQGDRKSQILHTRLRL